MGAYVTLIHKITVEMSFGEEKKYVTSFVEGPTAMLQFLESVVDTVAHTVHIYALLRTALCLSPTEYVY